MKTTVWLVPTAALLLLSCSVPYFETAGDPPGFSGGGGVGLADCAVQSDGPFQFLAPFGTAYVRYGFSRHISASIQANASVPWLDWSVGEVGGQLGVKYYFGRAGALRLCAAYPLEYVGPTVGLNYLFDLSKSWTVSAGVGNLVGSGWSGSGASLGVDYHFPLSGSMRCHCATVAAVAPVGGEGASLSFGVGIERIPPEDADGDQEGSEE